MGTVFGAFGLVFLAEFGDKSQLVALSLGARYRMRVVFLGMGIAYALINLLSVTVGAAVGDVASGKWVRAVGGVLFLLFAARGLFGGDADDEADADSDAADDPGDPGDPGDHAARPNLRMGRSVVASIAVSIFVAEFGDKTMLSAAALASQRNAVLVWVGATFGIMASSAVGVLIGKVVGDRLPLRWIRLASSAVFAAFGIAMLLAAFT
jgi:Ca2+/H+ antiporter, TMEM165/GDT1 family